MRGPARRGLPPILGRLAAALFAGLVLSGCGSRPPASPELTAFVGPLAVPYPDSVDVAWADSASARPETASPAPRPKRKRPTPAPGAGVTPPGGTTTSEATGQETATGTGAPTEAAPAAPELVTPQLTARVAPAEAVKLMERWQGDVARAEKALDLLKSFNLTGETADQVAAARKFLGESRVARAASDYYRACELAEKARVLAEAVKTSVGLK